MKNWTSNDSGNWFCFCKNWQEHKFVSDNTREAITVNWSAHLDKYDHIYKKTARKMYKKYLRLLRNLYHNIYEHIITKRTIVLTAWRYWFCGFLWQKRTNECRNVQKIKSSIFPIFQEQTSQCLLVKIHELFVIQSNAITHNWKLSPSKKYDT